MSQYVMFDHTADIGIEIFGRTKKELFANAAGALGDILFEPQHPGRKGIRRRKEIFVQGADAADLLINYLRELLYLVNGEGRVVRSAEITRLGNKSLTAVLRLETFEKKRHVMKTEIKAVTYHGLSVERERSGWRARVIFDV